jgi:hypothetical protein
MSTAGKMKAVDRTFENGSPGFVIVRCWGSDYLEHHLCTIQVCSAVATTGGEPKHLRPPGSVGKSHPRPARDHGPGVQVNQYTLTQMVATDLGAAAAVHPQLVANHIKHLADMAAAGGRVDDASDSRH